MKNQIRIHISDLLETKMTPRKAASLCNNRQLCLPKILNAFCRMLSRLPPTVRMRISALQDVQPQQICREQSVR